MRQVLDTSSRLCPVPLLMAKQRMRMLDRDDVLVVIATDPDASVDFGAWATAEGHSLSQRRVDDALELTVVKG